MSKPKFKVGQFVRLKIDLSEAPHLVEQVLVEHVIGYPNNEYVYIISKHDLKGKFKRLEDQLLPCLDALAWDQERI